MNLAGARGERSVEGDRGSNYMFITDNNSDANYYNLHQKVKISNKKVNYGRYALYRSGSICNLENKRELCTPVEESRIATFYEAWLL